MSKEPMGIFGWLMTCCVSDDSTSAIGNLFSAALFFSSGIAASGLTLYLAGVFRLT